MKYILIIIIAVLLIPFGMGALDNFNCVVGLPEQFSVPHGYALVFDLRDNAISGADYHTIEWVNTLNETDYHQGFAQLFNLQPAPKLNGTTIYNVSVRGYNATDSVGCPIIDSVTFEGKTMGIFEIAITTPYMILYGIMTLISIGLLTGFAGETAKVFGGLLGMILGIILIASGISYPIGFIMIGLFVVVGFSKREG